jgi:hypothetical protein
MVSESHTDPRPAGWDAASLQALSNQLTAIRSDMTGLEASFAAELAGPAYRNPSLRELYYAVVDR